MQFSWRWFGLIVMGGFVVRLVLAALAPHPGIADPNHYYNLARNLAAGRGFVIDYIWQYHDPPLTVTHPIDYWMPLPGVWPAIGIKLLGKSLLAGSVGNSRLTAADSDIRNRCLCPIRYTHPLYGDGLCRVFARVRS